MKSMFGNNTHYFVWAYTIFKIDLDGNQNHWQFHIYRKLSCCIQWCTQVYLFTDADWLSTPFFEQFFGVDEWTDDRKDSLTSATKLNNYNIARTHSNSYIHDILLMHSLKQ